METPKNDGKCDDLLTKVSQLTNQIQTEQFMNIEEKFKLNEPKVIGYSLQHQSLASNSSGVEDNNGRENSRLFMRMNKPLQVFKGLSEESIEKGDINNAHGLQTIALPVVDKPPRYTTWIFTDRNKLMAPNDSVIGKKQIYYVDGELRELSSKEEDEEDKEEIQKEKLEFSTNADRLIWEIGQKYGLDNLIVMSALTGSLKVADTDILERYNELRMMKNGGNVGEASNSISKSMSFTERNYCRRCYVFGCQMHGPTMQVHKSSEIKPYVSGNEDVKQPCHLHHCYLKQKSVTEVGNDKGKNVVDNAEGKNVVVDKAKGKNVVSYEWTPVEKDLYMKGVRVFGRDSCLVTRNFLYGLKSCVEVYKYMQEQDQCTALPEQNQTAERSYQFNKEVPRKRKNQKRKSTCYPTAIKRILKGGKTMNKQYNPCICDSACGDQCMCLADGNCCEKYCGCPKDCKNRYRGCICAKGKCGDGKCPCFAANRECDPDVCQNCMLSWGHASHGETSDENQCKNMKFTMKRRKKILLGKSDVQGWGAFTQDALKKNEFLGEFTGELIIREEAEERGRAEKLNGCSFIFILNDQFEIDPRRIGNQLKFLNHSENPNCYAKVVTVRGDPKIGIYAGKAIKAFEELFFDYNYNQDEQPEWYPKRQPLQIRDRSK